MNDTLLETTTNKTVYNTRLKKILGGFKIVKTDRHT